MRNEKRAPWRAVVAGSLKQVRREPDNKQRGKKIIILRRKGTS